MAMQLAARISGNYSMGAMHEKDYRLRPTTAIILWVISLWVEPRITLRILKEGHDIVWMEALRKIGEGLPPLIETTRALTEDRHAEQTWAKPLTPPKPGPAMYGVRPMLPPRY